MKTFFISLLLLQGSFAFAFPAPQITDTEVLVSADGAGQYDFEGIVALSNCSGSIVQLENAKDTDKALILTNGHCYEGGFPQPGTAVIEKSSRRTFRVLNSSAGTLGQVTATHVIYATMTGTDMSLYRLQETYADIKSKFNVRPLQLSSQHPETTTPIEVISGFWKRGYTCAIEKFIPTLKEDKWTMLDSIRYSRPGCETIGGTSGSPVIQAGTRKVIGVNNTGNEDGESCTMNNPCEIDNQGQVAAYKGYSYGQQTYWIYSCLNQNYEFDFKKEGCQLPH